MDTDQNRLRSYVDAWRSTTEDVVVLLRSLEEADWDRPTDLPGWTVRSVACHLAHLESELAGFEQEPVEVSAAPHVASPMGLYTEMGPVARSSWPTSRIVEELTAATAARYAELRTDPPLDGTGSPPRTPGGIPWDWDTLLSNRVVDVWMHEQDIRRAVERPGDMDRPGARHTVAVFARGLGYVVGKRVGPPPGTTVVLDVTGVHPVHLALEVDDSGRAVPVTDVAGPTASLRMPLESFVVLAGGRRTPADVPLEVAGDEELGHAILAAMAVTP